MLYRSTEVKCDFSLYHLAKYLLAVIKNKSIICVFRKVSGLSTRAARENEGRVHCHLQGGAVHLPTGIDRNDKKMNRQLTGRV